MYISEQFINNLEEGLLSDLSVFPIIVTVTNFEGNTCWLISRDNTERRTDPNVWINKEGEEGLIAVLIIQGENKIPMKGEVYGGEVSTGENALKAWNHIKKSGGKIIDSGGGTADLSFWSHEMRFHDLSGFKHIKPINEISFRKSFLKNAVMGALRYWIDENVRIIVK